MKKDIISFILWSLFFTVGIFLFVLNYLPKAHADNTWGTGTYKKQEAMMNLGWTKESSEYLINKCKESKEPSNCVLIATFISCAESSCTKNAHNFNILGIERKGKGVHFNSEKEAVDFWIGQYEKYWYKWALPIHYYGPDPKTGYCFPEKKNNWGQNGLTNATRAYKYFISFTK